MLVTNRNVTSLLESCWTDYITIYEQAFRKADKKQFTPLSTQITMHHNKNYTVRFCNENVCHQYPEIADIITDTL